MKAPLLPTLALLLAAAQPAAGETPQWRVETGSEVGFVARQAGAAVGGLFENFDAEIRFDPKNLEDSRVAVVIDVASVNSESKDRDDMIRSAALFDVATWPTARFAAERFVSAGKDHYEARGTLTLRDVTRELALPFVLSIEDHPGDPAALRARATGNLTVKRLDYGVGQGLWTDTSVVADEVVIRIDILAVRPKH